MSRTVVVGGGLSGLAAAHRLLEKDPAADVVVLEASDRVGGILGTVETDGFVVETGPDSILSEKRAAIELATRLGIADRIIETNTAHRGAYVVFRGALVKVPEGFSLMAPTRWTTWATTPIMSWPGKLRAAIEPLVPKGEGEESMARFVRRRFGREVLDRLAQPLVGGIYGGDPDRLSLAATMPRFVDLERRHGSVIRGMRAGQRKKTEQAASGARYGLFVAFDGAIEDPSRAVRLRREGGEVVATDAHALPCADAETWPDGLCAVLRPRAPLAPGSAHVIEVETDLLDATGAPVASLSLMNMGSDFSFAELAGLEGNLLPPSARPTSPTCATCSGSMPA